MLDGLLGRNGFSSKCKSLIKPTRTRIEALRRRAEAKQRFLKEDLAKLLANGLDVNAYGRTEEFMAGLNLLSCYTFIDQSCEYILKQLSVMQKLGQCPEECRETVASLMFAAARFSDLPELRDLRDVFQERYGNGLECFVNQVFVEKIASKSPVVEKRIKLLQDIAAEFSIQWDSKGFKQRMDNSSTHTQDQPKKLGPFGVTDEKYKLPNGNNVFRKNDQRSKERIEHVQEGLALHNNGNVNVRRKEVLNIPFVERNKKHDYKHEGPTGKPENVGYFSKGKPESNSEKNAFGKNDTPLMMKSSGSSYNNKLPQVFDDDRVFRGRKESYGYKQEPEIIETKDIDDHLFGGRQEMRSPRNSHDRRPEIPVNNRVTVFLKGEKTYPLYNGKSEGISNDKEDGDKSTGKVKEEEAIRSKPTYNSSLPPPYVKSNIPPPYSKPHNPSNSEKIKKESDHGIEEDWHYQNNIIPLPKPRSIRRKHSKSSSSHDDIGSSEDAQIVKRISSSRRKERKGLQILFDDEHYHSHRDEEEKMMDKLLLHYCKKPSTYDVGKLRKKKSRSNTSKSPSPHHNEVTVPPTRSISLPREQSGESETKKVYARANSFQPDNQAKHVHPKLPDYDDLAARFAALRGR